jgi:hypothetical protein
MGLMETQALLARLYTSADMRRAFFDDPAAVARAHGLDEDAARAIAMLDQREVEHFAHSLLGKRALDARKILPLSASVLGKSFDALLREALIGPPSRERHRADASALVRVLAGRDMEPPWICDLARYELAFAAAARPGAVLLLRRFAYPVEAIARQLLAGAHVEVTKKRRLGLWLRAPKGKLRWFVF